MTVCVSPISHTEGLCSVCMKTFYSHINGLQCLAFVGLFVCLYKIGQDGQSICPFLKEYHIKLSGRDHVRQAQVEVWRWQVFRSPCIRA